MCSMQKNLTCSNSLYKTLIENSNLLKLHLLHSSVVGLNFNEFVAFSIFNVQIFFVSLFYKRYKQQEFKDINACGGAMRVFLLKWLMLSQ